MKRKTSPIHPREILMEEFLRPLKITQYCLAKDIAVPPRRINEIIQGKRAISADTALRLSRYFGTSERFLDEPSKSICSRKRERRFG